MKFFLGVLLPNYVEHQLFEDMHERDNDRKHEMYRTSSTHRRCRNLCAISRSDQIKSGCKIYKTYVHRD